MPRRSNDPGGGGKAPVVHVPVLVAEVLELLDPRAGGRALDMTVGSGGHAVAIARRLGPEGLIVGIDRDGEAIDRARARLAASPARVCLRQADFAEAERVLDECGVREVDAVICDLGMSSEQLSDPARGFSFQNEGPIDMRMDLRETRTAADIVNDSSEEGLSMLFRELGEERASRSIAREIVRARSRERIRTTTELARLVEKARRGRRGRIHPATRVFQALRMAVNRELESVEKGLAAAWRCLASGTSAAGDSGRDASGGRGGRPDGGRPDGGRMAVISFHSLEDRIVKGFFRERKREGAAEILTKKVVRPGAEERNANPRSRSARLRVLRKLPGDWNHR